jgi:hypothetical protein
MLTPFSRITGQDALWLRQSFRWHKRLIDGGKKFGFALTSFSLCHCIANKACSLPYREILPLIFQFSNGYILLVSTSFSTGRIRFEGLSHIG